MHSVNRDTEAIQSIILVFLVIVIVLFHLLIPKHFINHPIIDNFLGWKKTMR
jgi:hypothetical protein